MKLQLYSLFTIASLLLAIACDQKDQTVQRNEDSASSELLTINSNASPTLPIYFHQISEGDSKVAGRITGMYENKFITITSVNWDGGENTLVVQEGGNTIGDFQSAVLVEIKEFEGYRPYNVPLVIYSSGEISEIEINNIPVEMDGSNNQLVRLNLDLEPGYNRIPILIRNSKSDKLESYLEVVVQ